MVYMKYISLHGLSIKPPPYPTQLPLRFWGNGLWLLDLVCQLSFITFLCRMWATCWLVWLMEHLERSHVPDMGEVANSVWLPGDEIQMGCNLFPDHVSTRWTKMLCNRNAIPDINHQRPTAINETHREWKKSNHRFWCPISSHPTVVGKLLDNTASIEQYRTDLTSCIWRLAQG